MRILILADCAGWIIDRITDTMIEKMPQHQFTKRYYEWISPAELRSLSLQVDLIHFQNVMGRNLISCMPDLKAPQLMSVRSHRYNPELAHAAADIVKAVHVVNPYLVTAFPGAVYIPDGIYPQFMTGKPFVVGYAGRPDKYKGFDLIQEACKQAGAIFKPATDLRPDQMLEYYNSIDLYVCASENEGHSTPVMECLAMNKPVITTQVGVPKGFNIHFVERTVESIRKGIESFYTAPKVARFTWENICYQFDDLYQDLA